MPRANAAMNAIAITSGEGREPSAFIRKQLAGYAAAETLRTRCVRTCFETSSERRISEVTYYVALPFIPTDDGHLRRRSHGMLQRQRRRDAAPRHSRASLAMREIKEDMEVIGADGVHIGTVDRIEGNRIKLTKKDSGEGSHKGHHHFIDKGLVADVEGYKVRLSANADVAVTMEEEK